MTTAQTIVRKPNAVEPALHHADKILAMFVEHTRPPKPACQSVALTHSVMTPSGGWANETIAEHPWVHIKDPAMLEDEIRDKSGAFWRAARDHANTWDRPQRYVVVCYGKSEEQILQRYDFLLAPSEQTRAMLGGQSEPANEAGVLAISLRYNEGLTGATFKKDAELFRLMHEEIAAVREENRTLRDENARMRDEAFKHMKATQDMILERHRLELAHERQKLDPLKVEAERTGEIWKFVTEGVLPTMLENVTGRPLLTAAAGGADGAIKRFLERLGPEKLTRMLEHLSPTEFSELQGVLGSGAGKVNGVS